MDQFVSGDHFQMQPWHRTLVRHLFHPDPRRIDISCARAAKAPQIPRLLYKYREFNNQHLEALQDNVLWAARPNSFVDKTDTGIRSRSPDFKLIEDEVRRKYRVLSLSASCSSQGMWEKYGGQSRGFCIEYDFFSPTEDVLDRDRRRISQIRDKLYPVFYRKRHPRTLDNYVKAWMLTTASRNADTLNPFFPIFFCIQKQASFREEQEWRVVEIREDPAYELRIAMPPIRRVIIGSCADEKHALILADYLRRKNIPLHRAVSNKEH
ncbi:MAG: DUF2971 domain-containing protein [Parvibaculum sp.]|nr:DUF2971 domain-containing protein [Parvibaculum sp.]